MTRTSVSDSQLAAVSRRTTELIGRVAKGSIDPDVVSAGLQALIEGRGLPTTDSATFDELVAAGHLTNVDRHFGAAFNSRWTIEKGDRVRGELFTLNMGRDYYGESDLPAALVAESKRRGCKVSVASAYEGAYYASTDWNGTDWVIMFGSYCWPYADRFERRCVARLWRVNSGERTLSLESTIDRWGGRNLVLCVAEPQ
jgi:hypothetical protein